MQFFRSIKPSHLGLMMVHMWIYCTTHLPSMTDEISVMSIMYSVLSAALLLLFVQVCRSAKMKGVLTSWPTKRMVNTLDMGAAFCMSLSAVLLSVQFVVPHDIAVVIASIAGGIGVSWAYMRWGEFYSKIDIHYATPLIFLTMALGSVGKTIIDFLPAIFTAFALALVPFLAFLLVRSSLKSVYEFSPSLVYYNSRTVGSLWRLALGIAVFSLMVGLIQSISLASLPTPYFSAVLVHHGSEVFIAIALFVWVVFLHKRLSFSRTWRLVLVLMATALIFEPFLDPSLHSYLLSLVRTAQTFLIVLLFLALADISRHSAYHPFAVFSLGWVSYSLPFVVGEIVGQYVMEVSLDPTAIMSAIVWVLVVVTLYFLDEASVGNHLVFTELNDGGGEDTPAQRISSMQRILDEQNTTEQTSADSLIARCAVVAKNYNLTPREHEILNLLARGRSKAYISDAFFISENTVRGHVKRIYSKMEVHSKQELLDKIESVV